MKILLTCGHPFTRLVCAHEILDAAGLGQLQAAERQPATPTGLRASILAALAVSTDVLGRDNELISSLVADGEQIMDANRGQVACVWADAGSVWLLELWKSMSPAIRFLLVYSAPEFAVAQMLRAQRAASGNIGQTVSGWIAWNTEMLRFYHRNPERCLLVNAATMVHAPVSFLSKVVESFDLSAPELTIDLTIENLDFPMLASSLAKALIEDREDAKALYLEMESTASVNAKNASVLESHEQQTWQEYSDLVASARDTSKTDALSKENEAILLQLHQVQEALEHSLLKSEELTKTNRQRDELVTKLNKTQAILVSERHTQARLLTDALEAQAKLAVNHQLQMEHLTKADAISHQNALLMRQMHEVQEELERCFLQSQDLARREKQQSDQLSTHLLLLRNSQPVEVTYDFRHDIERENWYPPEADGCWAGPGCISSFKVPPLGLGRFELQLDVVDAMEPGILYEMDVSLNGMSLPITKDWTVYPALVVAQFSTDALAVHTAWDFQINFPKVVSPRQLGADDSRTLAIRLRTVKLRKL